MVPAVDRESALLELVDVTRGFPGVLALDRVSFDLLPGEVHALVGENGAGKSTLINIVSGLLSPDSGCMRLCGQQVRWSNPLESRRAGIVTVHQEAELFATLSVAENMALEQGLPVGPGTWVRWREVYRDAQRAVAGLGEPIDVRQPAARLSVGQRQMTQIAAAVAHGAKVLVLDEPTSALSASETMWLFDRIEQLKSLGVGIVYISHRQEEVFRLADRITVLRDGRRVWSGPRATIAPAELIRHMVGRPVAQNSPPSAPPSANRQPRLEVDGLATADRPTATVSLAAFGGEIVGIYGLIGSGRSEFARAVFGLDKPASGRIIVDGQTRAIATPGDAMAASIAYLPEDRLRQGLFRGLSIRANAVVSALRSMSRGGLASAARERDATAQLIASLSIKCRDSEQAIGELSGGNQQKVVLARWLLTAPRVLLLDEPTRGVDVAAKAEIQRIVRSLARAGGAVLWISSDLAEVMQNSDRIVVFRAGRIVGEFAAGEAAAERIAAAALGETASQTDHDALPAGRSAKLRLRSELALATAVLAMFVLLGATSSSFATVDNLWGLLSSASISTVLALGAAWTILVGGIDISLGSLLALSAGVAGLVLKLDYPPGVTIPFAVLAALAVGLAGGLFNAMLTLAGRIHPIVVTLGTMTVFRGLLIAMTGGDTITDLPPAFVNWSASPLLGINSLVLAGALVAVVAHAWLVHLRAGRHALAFGSSATAARLAGISRWRVWLAAFGMGGFLAALAGTLQLAQTGAMQSGMGTGYELQAIAAAVIGGVSISGGRASVLGVCLAAFLLAQIHNVVVLWQIAPYQDALVSGALLLAAVLVDLAWRRLER